MRILRALLLALAALAAACGDSAKLAPLAPDAVILAFGDSLTFGTGASEAESYPAQLESLVGRRVVRAGVPGEVSAQALARLPGMLEEVRPQLLILCIGGNDFLRNLGAAQVEANVRRMVRLAQESGAGVLLIGTPEKGLLLKPPGFYAKLAKDAGIPYEGDVIGEILRKSELKSDPIHPNAKGYRLIAERVAERLRKAGAL
ncbi:MAG TPA: arylesterase [Burkholderiales bacterium]|nr:arylesterase [Burkholderiales bacterium]